MNLNLDNYVFSNYNHKISLEGNLFLYNALSGGFCKVDSEHKNIFENNDLRSDLKDIEELPIDIIEELINAGFIIDKDLDEFKLIKSKNSLIRFSQNNSLSLTLIPTTGCNFRCVYCFEKDKNYPNEVMSEQVMDEIINLIDTSLSDGGNLSISWYGGEPLLRFDILKKLRIRIKNLVDKKNLNFDSGIVTNGYLLNKEISDELVKLGVTNAQITIDGEKEIHDKKRFLVNGKGSFDKIIENLLNINKELSVAIRVNVDKENIDNLSKFINYINDCGIGAKENVGIYFAPVKNYDTKNINASKMCYSVKDFSKEEIELNRILYEKGLEPWDNISPNLGICGALSPNSFVIEPDGAIQKCWNLVGDKKSLCGHLIESEKYKNTILVNQSKWYSWSYFENEECKNCNVLPLCMGGCPYHTINNDTLKEKSFNCITQKFNLEDTLKSIAYRYLKEK